jgi:hypothetical protein
MASRETRGTGPWTAHVLERIHEVEAGLDSMTEWASEAGADTATTELLIHPYRELLDRLHQRGLALAAVADTTVR